MVDEETGEPVYEDGPEYLQMKTQYGEKTNGFADSYDIHTYNLTKDGISSFQYPFIDQQDGKGLVSNWNSGSEPVCQILSNVLSEKIFRRKISPWDGSPYTFHNEKCNPYTNFTSHSYAFAYVFRKNVPKIVFVFSNEYDNQISRTHYTSTHRYR